MDKTKLTVTEFSKISGISRQAIYKQMDKKLSKYVTMVDNQKCIDIKALKDVYNIEVDKAETTKSKVGDNSETTQKLIEMLENELKLKNKQIDELMKLVDQEQRLNAQNVQKIQLLESLENEKKERKKELWLKKIFSTKKETV